MTINNPPNHWTLGQWYEFTCKVLLAKPEHLIQSLECTCCKERIHSYKLFFGLYTCSVAEICVHVHLHTRTCTQKHTHIHKWKQMQTSTCIKISLKIERNYQVTLYCLLFMPLTFFFFYQFTLLFLFIFSHFIFWGVSQFSSKMIFVVCWNHFEKSDLRVNICPKYDTKM